MSYSYDGKVHICEKCEDEMGVIGMHGMCFTCNHMWFLCEDCYTYLYIFDKQFGNFRMEEHPHHFCTSSVSLV